MRTRNKRVGAAALVGLASGILLVPGIVGANARRGTGGSQQDQAIAERTYTAVLSGASEVGGGDADGTGAATLTIDRIAGTVCVDSATAGLDPVILTHIHKGAAGANGPVVIDFDPQGQGALSKCVTPASPTTITELLADPTGFYFNVHTTAYTAGAVRGQLAVHADGAGAVHLLPEPLRAYDSRVGTNPTKLAASETRTVNLWFGKDGAGTTKLAVPPGATGVLVTVTVTDTVGAGYLKVYSAALAAAPATSVINWEAANQNVATSTSVAVSSGADVKITAGPQATNVVVDVVGYYF